MFYLIGAGLQSAHLTREALDALSKADFILADDYTSAPLDGWSVYERVLGKKIRLLKRANVEEKAPEWLIVAKTQNVCLLVGGNPLSATTHAHLLELCRTHKIKNAILPGISIFNYRAWTGLDEYRFGRTVTIVRPEKNFAPESFFDQLQANRQNELHTLCLLDIKTDEPYFMTANEGLARLLEIERRRSQNDLASALVVFLGACGSPDQQIKAGLAKDMQDTIVSGTPQSLIVCAKLTETEKAHLETRTAEQS